MVRSVKVAALIGAILYAVIAQGETRLSPRASSDARQVELFQAMTDRDVSVQLVAKNAEQATVIVRNLTEKPLSIRMPGAFAGMPVLAQDDGVRNRDRGGGGNDNSNQSFGGGLGGGGFGGGGGFFNVGPDRVGKLTVATVCLEHGKKDPNPRVRYELHPFDDFSTNRELAEVCRMLGRGDLDQPTAQAAAWHLSDRLGWDELARKVRVRHLNGSVQMYFSPAQIRNAMAAVQLAVRSIPRNEQSPGEVEDRKSADTALDTKSVSAQP
jgi:hypothetical protein